MLVGSRYVFIMHFRHATWSSERNPAISQGASVFLSCACQRPVDSPVDCGVETSLDLQCVKTAFRQVGRS